MARMTQGEHSFVTRTVQRSYQTPDAPAQVDVACHHGHRPWFTGGTVTTDDADQHHNAHDP
jgi:hypothetical protein